MWMSFNIFFLPQPIFFGLINMPILYKSYKEKATYDIVCKPTTSYVLVYIRHRMRYHILYRIRYDRIRYRTYTYTISHGKVQCSIKPTMFTLYTISYVDIRHRTSRIARTTSHTIYTYDVVRCTRTMSHV